jgi:cytochrome c-type biogenesis protein CcmF
MFAEIGNLFLHLSLVSLFAIILSGLYPQKYRTRVCVILWMISCALVMASFLSLIACYVTSDFSVLNVVYNSHKLKPLIYKIAGTWSNHEGSMLLWTLAICIPSCLYGVLCNDNGKDGINCNGNKNLTLIIQSILAMSFVLFTIFTSNPFERVIPAPINGLGMNPLLQDIGVSFHPPILYLGYVGFSLPFSASLAVLITKNTNDWVKAIRPWVLFSWSFLTAGIATGSWWAYRELGWGGFWFWDPVENASLMPWITATALIHSLIIANKSSAKIPGAILLSISTFTLVMIGTFIVRSGTINSIHSFAQDSERGIFILVSIFFIVGSALVLYAFNSKKLLPQDTSTANPQTGDLIFINNIILSIIVLIVALGTIYPLILEVFFKKNISIGTSYYNLLVPPCVILLTFFCIYGTKKNAVLKWRPVILMSIPIAIVCAFAKDKIYSTLGIIFSSALIFVTVHVWIKQKNYNQLPMLLAHGAFALLVLSISLYYNMREERQFNIKLQETIIFRDMKIKLEDIQYHTMKNYFTKTAVIKVGNTNIVNPEIRLFPIEQQQTVEVDVLNQVFYDLYFSINSSQTPDEIILNIQFNPMVHFIWLSCALIFMAGIFSFVKKLFLHYRYKLVD